MVSSINSLHQIFLKGLSGSGWENRGAFVFGGHAAAWPSTATALMVWFMEGTSWSWLEVDFPDIDGISEGVSIVTSKSQKSERMQ